MAIDALRTPEDRFESLPDFDFAPHYIEGLAGYDDMRLHYVDEGPADAARTFLCLHGEPTWSYLYRKMIPVFTAAGHRSVAPDFFGFGRSDKPVADSTYTMEFHRTSMVRFVEQLDLANITLVCQDWGGLIGLTLPMDMPERFTRLLVMNTGIGTGQSPGEGFLAWKKYAADNPDMDVAALMARSTPVLSDAEARAYGAPFPDHTYKGGVRRFPELVPISPEMDGVAFGKRAVEFWRNDWDGESFMAIGMQDPVLGPPAMHALHKVIRNCPAPMKVADAGHFVQEWGEPIAKAALAHWGDA